MEIIDLIHTGIILPGFSKCLVVSSYKESRNKIVFIKYEFK